MKPATHFKRSLHTGITLALALVICTTSHMQSAESEAEEAMSENRMMVQCAYMKTQRQVENDEVNRQDASLAELIATMNSAPADKKVALIAAVVTRMAEQRIAMHAKNMTMNGEMTKHMMQHMQMGKGSMSRCPMMMGMMGMDDKNSDDPK